MKILLNGDRTECADSCTVDELVANCGLPPASTLIEHNGSALHRREWSERKLAEDDRIEILRVAAGG
ncbi:MAG: sulfur carrier protein ThiS [Chthoniobacterales bacterium]